jgi:hypothetical protein
MKAFALSVVLFAAFFSLFADNLARFSPDFSNTKILWQVPTNSLPESFWIYQRLPPHPFSATIISNAMVLSSLQDKECPKPSTNSYFIWGASNPCGMSASIFSIIPTSATITYGLPNPGTNTADIPADQIIVRRAWACAAQLGVDPAQIRFKEMTSSFNQDENDNDLTNQVCGRGVFLSRDLDGLLFWNDVTQDGNFDGFWMEFGSQGKIRAFSLVWPDLGRTRKVVTASPNEIIQSIRKRKILVFPEKNETNLFGRIKNLANAKTFTIVKITPLYIEGVWGETPTNDEPPQLVSPIAEIEAVADFGDSSQVARILTPVTVPDVKRLLK